METLTLWLTPREAGHSAMLAEEDKMAYAAQCAGVSLGELHNRMTRQNYREVRIRVCVGLLFCRIVPTARA